MSELDSILDAAGMAFMLCGETEIPKSPIPRNPVDKNKITFERLGKEHMPQIKERQEIITGLSDVMTAERPRIYYDPNKPATDEEDQKIEEVAKCVEGMDYNIILPKGNKRVELKSISGFLTRQHGKKKDEYPILNNEHGTLYAELFNKTGKRPGWLLNEPDKKLEKYLPSLPDPEEKDTEAARKARDPFTPEPERYPTYLKPDYLIWLLFADTQGEYPFAAVSFEWDAFLRKMPYPMHLWYYRRACEVVEIGSIISGVCTIKHDNPDLAWLNKRLVKGGSTGYCCHISMDELADIARVTMIGDEAQIKTRLHNEFPERGQLIDTRYQWLKDHSNGRHIDT